MFIDKEIIEIKNFTAKAFLRYQNNIYHKSINENGSKTYILLQKANKYNLFLSLYHKFDFFKISLLSFEDLELFDYNDKSLLNEENLIGKIILSFKLDNFNQILYKIVNENKITLKYSYLEVYGNQQDDNIDTDAEIFQVANYYSSGIPPLVLIENENYHFPLRSGIPLGINDLHPVKQTFEIPLHGRVYIHSPIIEQMHDLRELHYNILKENFETLPYNLLLFEYKLNEFKK